MPVNMYYSAVTGYEIRHLRGNPTGLWPPIKIHELLPHPETDKVEDGCSYFAFTEYSPRTGNGTVAFKRAEDVIRYKQETSLPGSYHLIHYHMFHEKLPQEGDMKIFTGWSVQSDGDLKFSSGSMNLGDKLYHHMRYYTNVVLAPSRQAKSVEQPLLRTYVKRWKDADQPVHDWKMLPVEQTLPPQLSVSG